MKLITYIILCSFFITATALGTVELTTGNISCTHRNYNVFYSVTNGEMTISRRDDAFGEIVRDGDDGYNTTVTYLESLPPQTRYTVTHHEETEPELEFTVVGEGAASGRSGLGTLNSFGYHLLINDPLDPFDIKGEVRCHYTK